MSEGQAILVIGGGISGITTSLEAAEAGENKDYRTGKAPYSRGQLAVSGGSPSCGNPAAEAPGRGCH